jgi:hypothetical protein
VINFINQNSGSLPGPDGEAAPPAAAAVDAVYTQLGAPLGQPSTAETNELLSALLLSTAEQDSTGLRRR